MNAKSIQIGLRYIKIVWWELALQKTDSPVDMQEVLQMQKECKHRICKIYKENYEKWFSSDSDDAQYSPNVLKHYVFPHTAKKSDDTANRQPAF